MSTEQSASPPTVTSDVERYDRHLSIALGDEDASFHYVWLRDNCWCDECRVAQSGERRLFTAYIPSDIAPVDAWVVDGLPEGRLERRARLDIRARLAGRAHAYSLSPEAGGAGRSLGRDPRRDSVVPARRGGVRRRRSKPRTSTLFATYGAAIVTGTPSVEGEVERFAETDRPRARDRVRAGPQRAARPERLQRRAHTPRAQAAHRPAQLPLAAEHPAAALPRQRVHRRRVHARRRLGGAARPARRRTRRPSTTLCSGAGRASSCSARTRTPGRRPRSSSSTRPGSVRLLPVLQPARAAAPGAVRRRRRRSTAPTGCSARCSTAPTTRSVFKTRNGDLLTVHCHRVLHGRLAFDPASGARHLQDVYMEFDDLMARRGVLAGTHKPRPVARR